MEKTVKHSDTNRGDHFVAVFELSKKRCHRSGRFWVHADIRIAEIHALCGDCSVVALIEDGIEMDGRGHELYVGRDVIWEMIRVASWSREDPSALSPQHREDD